MIQKKKRKHKRGEEMCTVELKDVIYSSNQIPGDERMGRGSIQGSNS